MQTAFQKFSKLSLLSIVLAASSAMAQSPIAKITENPILVDPKKPEFKIDIPKPNFEEQYQTPESPYPSPPIDPDKEDKKNSPKIPKKEVPKPDPKEPLDKDNKEKLIIAAPLSFSQQGVNEDAKVTQLKIRNFEDLKKAGIKEEEIYKLVHEFESFAKNFYFKYVSSDGKVIFLVTLSPALENGRMVAIERGIKIDSDADVKKFCEKEPTHCSVTSIASFQNGQMPSMKSFEDAVYKHTNEIYWKNLDYDGKIDFFFEISLRNET